MPETIAKNFVGTELQNYPGQTSDASSEAQEYKHRQNKYRGIGYDFARLGLAAMIAIGVPVGAVAYDQNTLTPAVQGENVPSMHQVASNRFSGPLGDYGTFDGNRTPPTFRTHDVKQPATVVVVVGGFGMNSSEETVATPLIPSLSEAIPNSKLYSFVYGSRIDKPGTFRAIDAMLEETRPDRLIYYGMSTGCKEAFYQSAYVAEAWPDIEQTEIICDSGPYNAYSAYALRGNPATVNASDLSLTMQTWGGVGLASGYDILSDDTRRKYMRSDGSIDFEKLDQEIDRIVRDKWTKDAPGNELLLGQVAIIADDSVRPNLETIAESLPNKLPTIVYLFPTRDTVIDGAYASGKFRDDATALGFSFKVVRVESQHAGPNDYAATYNATIIETQRRIQKERQAWRDLDGRYDQSITLSSSGH